MKTKFSEYSFDIFACIFSLLFVIAIACAILFSPYNRIVSVVVDGVEYECVDYEIYGNIVELHTCCAPTIFSMHTNFCDKFYVTCIESIEIITETNTNYELWFGGDNVDQNIDPS